MEKEDRDRIRDAFAMDVQARTDVPFVIEYRFAKPERQWRADVAWPDVQVALEIDGGTWTYGRHNRAGSILADMEKGNGYAARGWLVFHTPWDWLRNTEKRAELLEQVANTVIKRVSK